MRSPLLLKLGKVQLKMTLTYYYFLFKTSDIFQSTSLAGLWIAGVNRFGENMKKAGSWLVDSFFFFLAEKVYILHLKFGCNGYMQTIIKPRECLQPEELKEKQQVTMQEFTALSIKREPNSGIETKSPEC